MSKTGSERLVALYIPAFFICLAARLLLKFYWMDNETGFYAHNAYRLPEIFTALFLLITAVMFLIVMFHKTDNDYPTAGSSVLEKILCFLTGLSIVYYTVAGHLYASIDQGLSLETINMRQKTGLILGLAAGAALLLQSILMIFAKKMDFAAILLLLPCIWQSYMILTRFSEFTVITTLPDKMFTVLFMTFACVFYVGQARIVLGITHADAHNFALPSGLAMAMSGILLVVPNSAYALMGRLTTQQVSAFNLPENIYTFCASAYAVCFTLRVLRSIKKV